MFEPTHLPWIFFHCDEEWKPSLPEDCVQRSNSHGADAHSRSGSCSGSHSNSRNDTPCDAKMKAGHHCTSLDTVSLIWSVQMRVVLLFKRGLFLQLRVSFSRREWHDFWGILYPPSPFVRQAHLWVSWVRVGSPVRDYQIITTAPCNLRDHHHFYIFLPWKSKDYYHALSYY